MQRVAENLPHGPRTLQAAQEGSGSGCCRPTFLPLPPWESPRQIVHLGNGGFRETYLLNSRLIHHTGEEGEVIAVGDGILF